MYSYDYQPLVSIIVPVYNVEDYLPACLESIQRQDYNNTEIIIVNDGSTDNSGSICDKAAAADDRIKVIHQENGGLSAARNAGINQAAGEYIVFVDSDDLMHPSYISVLLSVLSESGCKLAMCDMQRFHDAPEIVTIPENTSKEILTSRQTIQRFLQGEWWSAPAKIYKSELFESIRFPVGRNNEDYAILTRIFEQCEKVVYLRTPLYFYRCRVGSITKSALNDHSFDEIDNCVDVLEYIAQKHPEFYAEAEANLAYSLEKLYRELQSVRVPQYANRLQQILKLYKKHGASFLKNPIIMIQSRFFIWFHVKMPFLAPIVVKSYILYKSIL